jgi:hypothetical protein
VVSLGHQALSSATVPLEPIVRDLRKVEGLRHDTARRRRTGTRILGVGDGNAIGDGSAGFGR